MGKKRADNGEAPDAPVTALLIMAEYSVGDPVWDRSPGRAGPVSWVRQGLHLAYDLQWELPDIDVRYAHADDDRPLRR